MKVPDLFDDDPPANSPEDLGMGAPFEPRQQSRKRPPNPWDTAHPDHPSNRPENKILTGEKPPESWNVAKGALGIQHMRTFLEWCESKGIDNAGHTVGTLYVGLNAHSVDSFRWLCTVLGRQGFTKLPPIVSMSKAILARDIALLYSDGK